MIYCRLGSESDAVKPKVMCKAESSEDEEEELTEDEKGELAINCVLMSPIYRVAHKKRPELSHGIMQQRNQNESTE